MPLSPPIHGEREISVRSTHDTIVLLHGHPPCFNSFTQHNTALDPIVCLTILIWQ
ncbi:hypothetical protein PAXRUDRAFT_823789 [Paxillus rubicundulus Ve08.2h10]|uniref:Uncharacterized protein n=1 Tax=Paxillus rubicundulus Ve08.2h10 TaxID=930991 RepID=A0A0D0E333_9AGAM|nr:hypothetical protein PAXRUDRAFT_823789 [Paxillus rubicundulus Ve08.2h10]